MILQKYQAIEPIQTELFSKFAKTFYMFAEVSPKFSKLLSINWNSSF